MATYAEIEDVRDWILDVAGEVLIKVDSLNGDEPECFSQVRAGAETASENLVSIASCLNAIMVQKKREEGEPE